jgi:hypothetical protein
MVRDNPPTDELRTLVDRKFRDALARVRPLILADYAGLVDWFLTAANPYAVPPAEIGDAITRMRSVDTSVRVDLATLEQITVGAAVGIESPAQWAPDRPEVAKQTDTTTSLRVLLVYRQLSRGARRLIAEHLGMTESEMLSIRNYWDELDEVRV